TSGSASNVYQGDYHYAAAGTGSSVANWTFSNLAAGQYQVYATYPQYSNRATNAPFSIYDGTTSRGSVLVNEQVAPADDTAHGASWKSLGTFTLQSGSARVALSN